ncbi:hypothetical protein TWF281_001848 [Arthrobotrys megalospora]
MAAKTAPPNPQLRGRFSTPDIKPSHVYGGARKKQVEYRLSAPSLREEGGKETKSHIKGHKTPAAKDPVIYRPPSSLATSRSRSKSPTTSRARTPSIRQQPAATASDRRARQTTLYLNITTAPPPTRSPLGPIESSNLPPSPNPYIENNETRPGSTWAEYLEHPVFPPSSPPEPELEKVDENQRESKLPGHSGHPDFPSSPPLKFDFEKNEDPLDNGYWSHSSFLQYSKESERKGDEEAEEEAEEESEEDPLPVFWSPSDVEIIAAQLKSHPLGKADPKANLQFPVIDTHPIPTYMTDTFGAPRGIPFFTNDEVFKLHNTLNFDNYQQWDRIVQLHEVHKTRSVEFDRLSPEARDTWFTPPVGCEPCIIRQQWGNCAKTDDQLIRDIYCAYYVAISNVLAIAGDPALGPSSPPPSGWMEVLIDPFMLINEMRAVLQWSDETIDALRTDYGFDFFQFIDTQYELKSMSYLSQPTITLMDRIGDPGYVLTCKRTQAGRYKLRLSPPFIQTYWSIKQVNDEFECTVEPKIWHPNFGPSRTAATPRFSVGKDAEWLRWDQNRLCFWGIIPCNYQPKKDLSGRWCAYIEITADYNQCFWGRKLDGADFFYLRESITSRSYGILPTGFMKSPPATPPYRPIIYPSNPLQFLWNSQKLGFSRKHSKFIVQKVREYERELDGGCVGGDAKAFVTYGKFPWDPKEPPIQSWGQVTWIDFLQQRRNRAEYLRNDPRGRFEVIRDLKKGPRYEPLNLEHIKDNHEVDEDLEEMRRMYENLNHEAHAIVWLNTVYRESLQDRLEDESFGMETKGVRSLDSSPWGSGKGAHTPPRGCRHQYMF